MIIIEGQIGAGKTTMGEILERHFDIPLYRELGNPDTLNMLDRFYADKGRWAFTMQIHFLNERFRMIKDIHAAGGGLLEATGSATAVRPPLRQQSSDDVLIDRSGGEIRSCAARSDSGAAPLAWSLLVTSSPQQHMD